MPDQETREGSTPPPELRPGRFEQRRPLAKLSIQSKLIIIMLVRPEGLLGSRELSEVIRARFKRSKSAPEAAK